MDWILIYIIAFLISYIFLNVFVLILSLLNYKKFVGKYNFLNMFSFELTNLNDGKESNTIRILYSFFQALVFFISILFFKLDLHSMYHILFLISILLMFSSIVIKIIQLFTKTTRIELFHKLFAIRILTLLSSIITLFLFYVGEFSKLVNDYQNVKIVIISILVILFSYLIFSIINPRLYRWYELDFDSNGDTSRKKICPLSFLEWSMYFLDYIMIILISVTFLFL